MEVEVETSSRLLFPKNLQRKVKGFIKFSGKLTFLQRSEFGISETGGSNSSVMIIL
jgi:hypothetical protein